MMEDKKAIVTFDDERDERSAMLIEAEIRMNVSYAPRVPELTTKDGQSVYVFQSGFIRMLDEGSVRYRLVGLDEMGMQMDPMTYSRLEDALGINTNMDVCDERLDAFFKR